MRAIKITSRVELKDIRNRLHDLQQEVLGSIECVPLRDGGIMLVNEEGAINGMPQNPIASLVAGTMIYGPVLIVGNGGEDFTDVPDAFDELLQLDTPIG